jgi:hypothetical protein
MFDMAGTDGRTLWAVGGEDNDGETLQSMEQLTLAGSSLVPPTYPHSRQVLPRCFRYRFCVAERP